MCVGGVAAAIPRYFKGQKSWAFDSWECASNSPFIENNVIEIKCAYKGKITSFLYDSALGIVSYTNQGFQVNREMVLVGEAGLLAVGE